MPEMSRCDVAEVRTERMLDADVAEARWLCERLAAGRMPGLSDRVRLFYADLAAQLADIACYRAAMLAVLDPESGPGPVE